MSASFAPSDAASQTGAPEPVRRSLVIPVYRNAENIPDLVAALEDLGRCVGPGFETLFVVDGSPDDSGRLLLEAAPRLPFPTTVAFHSRNFGSFTAIRTGLELARGEHVAAMAADLQEPPELIAGFFEALARDEADVIFGRRTDRDDPPLQALFSSLFWGVYRRLVSPDVPKGGVDVFACNRRVREAVLSIVEPNSSLVAQLFWVGFRRSFVPYARRRRRHGRSAWGLSRRLRYMTDSIVSFSDAPLLFLLWSGIAGCLASLVLGLITFVGRLSGAITVPGYSTLVLGGVFFGSAILVSQGIIGCYLWRTFENTKRRPLRIVTHVVSAPGAGA